MIQILDFDEQEEKKDNKTTPKGKDVNDLDIHSDSNVQNDVATAAAAASVAPGAININPSSAQKGIINTNPNKEDLTSEFENPNSSYIYDNDVDDIVSPKPQEPQHVEPVQPANSAFEKSQTMKTNKDYAQEQKQAAVGQTPPPYPGAGANDVKTFGSYEQQPKPAKNPDSKGKIIKLVAIVCILIFVFAGSMLLKKIIQVKQMENKETVLKNDIQIDLKQVDDKVDATVVSKTPIKKVVYVWNNDLENEKVYNPSSTNQTTANINGIEIPRGKNTLKIKVVDQNGKDAQKEQEFVNEKGKDVNAPQIKILFENGIIKILVTDDVALKEIKYIRSGEQPKIEIPGPNNKKEYKLELKPLQGSSKITVIAIDEEGNQAREEKSFVGVVAPEIKIVQTGDREKINITVTHPVGVKKIEYDLNGKIYVKDIPENEQDNKKINILQVLDVGINRIRVIAKSVEGIDSPMVAGTVERPNSSANAQTSLVQQQAATPQGQPATGQAQQAPQQ